MDPLSDFDKLSYYRDEIKFEFNLLATRSTFLVTCQSFLIVPFAILQTSANFRTVIFPLYLIAALGIFMALVIRNPINAAHRTINKWVLKQRGLLKTSQELRDLLIDRDMIPGVEKDLYKDKDHIKSLTFTRYGPWAFFIFWIMAIVWSTVRACVGF